MAQLTPYLNFNGTCREAMTFYQDCLGGELSIQTVGDSPMAQDMPAGLHNRVLHSMLKHDAMVLMASDLMRDGELAPGNVATLCINGDSRAATRAYFDKLAAGGTVTRQIDEAFFGLYGDLTDKYGINWMFQAE